MTLRNRFNPVKNENTRSEIPGETFSFFSQAMPQDIVNLLTAELPRHDRAAFACTSRRMARAARQLNLQQAKTTTENQLSASSTAFMSLDEVENCLQNLIDYTYGFNSPDETSQQKQFRLAHTMRLILESMYYISLHTALTFKFIREDDIADDDDNSYMPVYRDIEQQNIDNINQIANQIQSATSDKLKTNMATLSDVRRSIAQAVATHNTTSPMQSIANFATLFSCGLLQSRTTQENKLICLLVASSNVIGYKLNELNKTILAPIRLIESQRIYRR